MALKFGRLPRLLGARPAADGEAPPARPPPDAPTVAPHDTAESFASGATGVRIIEMADLAWTGAEEVVDLNSDDSWIAFELDPDAAAAAPLGELTVSARAVDASAVTGRLYIDFGTGLCEADSLEIPPEGKVYLSGPAGIRRLRWDLDDKRNRVVIDRIRFTPLVSTEELKGRIADLQGGNLDRALLYAVDRAVESEPPSAGAALERTLMLMRLAFGIDGFPSRRLHTRDFDELSADEVQDLHRVAQEMTAGPVISVLVPVYRTDLDGLRQMIDSVLGQIYPNWELCLADDCSRDERITRLLTQFEAEDPRIKVVHRQSNGHISAASNSALDVATGDWVAMLDHDDVLSPDALLRVAQYVEAHPDIEVVYSDEDKLSPDGARQDAFFKPDFSIELFRAQNYLNHLTVVRASSVRTVGGWRLGYEGSQDYDLLLRIIDHCGAERVGHIPRVLYHWRMAAGSTAVSADEKGYAYFAGVRALEDHLTRRRLRGHVEKTPAVPYYRLRLDIPEPAPRVTLIIPTRDRADTLALGVDSILLRTDYPNFEVLIVDNGSVESETTALFDRLRADSRVRVVAYDAPFNFSAINNFGVAQTDAPLVALVNNDVEVISPDWLTEMVSWTVQPDVGCVGAKLYYPNNTIQHAGVILGIGGVAGHSHKHLPRRHQGYFSRLMLVQDMSAVTAACLLVRRSIYLDVGGLNEADLSVAFNDVDFCLKVRRAGYRNVFTPFAELYHYESVSRGAEDDPAKIVRFNREIDYMKRTWGAQLLADPFYSPHLTLTREDFSPA